MSFFLLRGRGRGRGGALRTSVCTGNGDYLAFQLHFFDGFGRTGCHVDICNPFLSLN